MQQRVTVPLIAIATHPGHTTYEAILDWPFADEPFYERQVKRLLKGDMPQRMLFSACRFWVYRDRAGDNVGFGSLDVSDEYARHVGGKKHPYVPLPAVNPLHQKRGHGRTIVERLVAEATLVASRQADVSDVLFLDVYVANRPAIALYEKCGFTTLNPDAPILDPAENDAPYFVMAKKLAVAP